jgi:hypothetical protein
MSAQLLANDCVNLGLGLITEGMGCTGIRVSAIPREERAGIALQILREDFDRVGGERDLAQRTDGLEIERRSAVL